MGILTLIAVMSNPRPYPSLKPLHPDSSLNPAKLAHLEKVSTEILKQSLLPGQPDSLKARPDGTILNGHHRVYILRKRGIGVDTLPREIIVRENLDRPEEHEACGPKCIGLMALGLANWA